MGTVGKFISNWWKLGKEGEFASVFRICQKVLTWISGAVALYLVSSNFWKTSVICCKLYLICHQYIEVISAYQQCLLCSYHSAHLYCTDDPQPTGVVGFNLMRWFYSSWSFCRSMGLGLLLCFSRLPIDPVETTKWTLTQRFLTLPWKWQDVWILHFTPERQGRSTKCR